MFKKDYKRRNTTEKINVEKGNINEKRIRENFEKSIIIIKRKKDNVIK